MADLLPSTAPNNGVIMPADGSALGQLRGLADQPAMRRLLPWFMGMAALGMLALTYSVLMPAQQRILYSTLGDGERAEVAAALDQASIDYTIDSSTGALTVGEDDLYRARMTVASQGALAMPESGTQLIDALPMGASRTLEGDRLRAAQERELQLTIIEIDGIQAARVHLAQAEESVFVRESNPPTASVMLRLARGNMLSEGQVRAIANLVAASVPGLTVENVRIVDQHGRLLSDTSAAASDALDLQARTENKLRSQISQLLTPMLGAGNFSTEIQVVLDMEEVTSARESYDRDGAVRAETTSQTTGPAQSGARGIPGATSNTPPVDPEAQERAPVGTQLAEGQTGQIGASNASRTYELGREVAVSSTRPGGVQRLSVAVALNESATEEMDEEQLASLEELVAAAVGADTARGDRVAVMSSSFEAPELTEPEFWETPWFATIVRHSAALLGVLMVLLLGVRPLFKLLRPKETQADQLSDADDDSLATDRAELGNAASSGVAEMDAEMAAGGVPAAGRIANPSNSAELGEQVELARRIAREQPDDALQALRRMLASKPDTAEAG